MAHSRDNFIDRLPPDLLAEIHGCLGFVDRIVFTIACGVHSWSMLKPEVPCLVHSGVALDRHATACTADPAMHDYIVLGSSAGWLITADVPCGWPILSPESGPLLWLSNKPAQLRRHAHLEPSLRRPSLHHGGEPRLAPSRNSFEDAIHHDGSFYSATYSGTVEAWDHGGGDCEFVSRVVAPRLAFEENHLSRKYLAAAPNGRLMAMLKYLEEEGRGYNKDMRVSFKAHVLDKKRGRWEETTDIGGAALFVGVNGTLCVPTRDHGGLHLLHRRRCRTGLAAP
nr:uncharacterized protein LOC117863727 [Setaria viridis]